MKLIRIAMRSTPHELHIARDGSEGLALIERLVPDLVVTDVRMPGLEGYELIAALKARPRLAHIPVIVLSASAQRVEQDEALRRGAIRFLAKPFGSAELRRVIAEELAAVRPRGVAGRAG